MQPEIYRLLSLAAACNLSSDIAYDMLQQDFISTFSKAYESTPEGEDKPSVLDAFIRYAMEELPIRTGVNHNVVYELRSKREDIVNTFLTCDLSTMMTQMASRKTVLEHIRQFLRKENEIPRMYSMINSSRVNVIFTQFLEVFKKNCAHAFQYRGSFVIFVMNCFIKFYYKGNKRDIWAFLRETDLEKREIEQSAIVERELVVSRTDDMLIHDLVLNISLANDMFFAHSGSADDAAHGVMYDIYYLVLCELCKRKVEQINAQLGDKLVRFVDPLDRREAWLGLSANKGIAAKINNARELVTYVYEYVNSGRLNLSSLADLRDMCFTLGKHDREGRNCIWKDVVRGGETSRYLDVDLSVVNYEHFDLLLKGVISVHTLMEGIESRGFYLVDTYNRDLFQDRDIVRYIDYLSSVEYIDLMRQLQKEPLESRFLNNGLLEFPEMVEEYAGSFQNTQTHIRENQYYAITHGFLVKPKLKQAVMPTSNQEVLQKIARAIDLVPRSFREYISTLDQHQQQEYTLRDWIDLRYSDLVDGKYNSKYFNTYIVSKPDKAAYYLRGRGDLQADKILDGFEWSVGTAWYEAVLFNGIYGVYVPLEHCFLFYTGEGIQQPFKDTMEGLMKVYQSSYANGMPTVNVMMLCDKIVAGGFLENTIPQLLHSVGFPWEIGIRNLCESDVIKRLDALNINHTYNQQLKLFYRWCDENSKIQHSFIEILKAMFTETIFCTCGSEKVMSIERAQDIKMSRRLFNSLITGEFDTESLTWILEKLRNDKMLETADWSSRKFKRRGLDITLLDYLWGDVKDTKAEYKELSQVIEAGTNVAEKFVLAYNHVYTKLLFLRKLRDAYSLLVNHLATDASTLVCELDHRFGVDTKLNGFVEDIIDYGIRVETIDYADVQREIKRTKKHCVKKFRQLMSILTEYVHDCREEIAKLVDYNIVAQDVIASRFTDLGEAFAILPAYPETLELAELRKIASTDAAGFFLMGGSYFHGRSGQDIYYVHRSGRMVLEVNGRLEPMDYDLNDEASRRRYTDIIRKGLALRGYKD